MDGALASGSGLGLAIARELAGLMRGALEVGSTQGRTTFSLALPAAADDADSPSIPRENEPEEALAEV